jgi:uncharacterized protein (DUF433 family)
MQALDRITVDPAVMNGQPCLRAMRLTVRRVLEIAALYPDTAQRRKDYPDLEDDDVAQANSFELGLSIGLTRPIQKP